MKAEFEYSEDEVAAIVLTHHTKLFATPEGMRWGTKVKSYGSKCLTIEAVVKEQEGGAG